jgi:hypothetical protein
MNQKLLNCLTIGALVSALSLASPALGRGGFGGGMGGGMHGGAMGGIGGGMHGGAFASMGRGTAVGAMGGTRFGPQFNGARFANGRFVHAAFSPRFSSFAFHHGFHHPFSHRRFNRFAFVGIPFAYAAYDSCWSQVWTSYGPQLINVCAGYGY